MKFIQSKSILLTLISISFSSTLFSEELTIDFPEGYRNWTHIKSMVIQEGHPLHSSFGGLHHIYANEKALQGYTSGEFPNGSIIIFDLLDTQSENNAITEGKRKVLGVMEKDNTRFKDTKGWGFEGFSEGNPAIRAVGNNFKQACFACHTSQENNDYVFSRWRE